MLVGLIYLTTLGETAHFKTAQRIDLLHVLEKILAKSCINNVLASGLAVTWWHRVEVLSDACGCLLEVYA
jgi:hypothetical protein